MSETAAFSYAFATLQQLAEDVLKHASNKGATACEVDVSEGFGQSVTVRCDEVETIEFNRDKGIGITVYSGQRKGYASTSDFSAQALRETVEAALNIARFTAEDDCAGLADAALMARDCPDLDLYHPWALSVEESIVIFGPIDQVGCASAWSTVTCDRSSAERPRNGPPDAVSTTRESRRVPSPARRH